MSGDEAKRGTQTSNFGVSRREAHDSTAFYQRFEAPEITRDDAVLEPLPVPEPFILGDATQMTEVASGSVALVVTSPPYFVGKQYEEELERDGVPSSYQEYLELLHAVFAECKRTLEPGGRIAVNVANLGRRPYRSLSADVIRILQDELHLLLRGEVIWQKGEGASGSCAWGSFRKPANPVLRDITERVIVASKGRFDRAKSAKERAALGLPHRETATSDEFMAATLDVWDIPAESAKRVGHPAPFPIDLPQRLIDLYTYEDDLILDPFMGSGTTLVAAAKLRRRYVGYDTDPTFVALARSRVERLTAVSAPRRTTSSNRPRPIEPPLPADPAEDFQARATKEGKAAQGIAEQRLRDAGFTITHQNSRLRGLGVTINFIAEDDDGVPWYFDVSGAFTTTRGGLLRTDTVWKSLGHAHVLSNHERRPLVLLTSHLPNRPSEGDTALRAAGPTAFFDAIAMLSDDGFARLQSYAAGGQHVQPLPGFWTEKELERNL